MTRQCSKQDGSILLYILLGIVLIGALTVALRNTGGGSENIDREDLILKTTQVQKYGSELAMSVGDLVGSGVSEAAIRFAHPDAPAEYGTITTDPTNQVFAPTGGKATYRTPPEGVNDGSSWEFFGTSNIPQTGSDKAELIAVLPNVTEDFCKIINSQLGFATGSMPIDKISGFIPECIMGSSAYRFVGTFTDTNPNVLDDTTFTRLPALQACVYCTMGGTYNYYYVLLAR